MQSTFKAVVLKNFNVVEIQEFKIPTKADLKPHHVLVKMECAGICGAQINEITGAKGPDAHLPHFLGHEGVGRVVAVGSCVTHLRVKDRVVLHWRKGLGGEESKGVTIKNINGESIGGGPVTTWGEYTIVSENRCTQIGNKIPARIAALFGCAYSTGFGIIEHEAGPILNKSILLVGCGGVGLCALIAAKNKGAKEINVYEISRKQRLLASSMGAFVGDSRELFSRTYDVVVELTGRPELIEWGLERTAPGGKLVLVGQPKANDSVTFKNFRQHYVGKTILDSQGGGSVPYLSIPIFESNYCHGLLNGLHRVIGDVCMIDTLPSKINDILNGNQKRAGRCLIDL